MTPNVTPAVTEHPRFDENKIVVLEDKTGLGLAELKFALRAKCARELNGGNLYKLYLILDAEAEIGCEEGVIEFDDPISLKNSFIEQRLTDMGVSVTSLCEDEVADNLSTLLLEQALIDVVKSDEGFEDGDDEDDEEPKEVVFGIFLENGKFYSIAPVPIGQILRLRELARKCG